MSERQIDRSGDWVMHCACDLRAVVYVGQQDCYFEYEREGRIGFFKNARHG